MSNTATHTHEHSGGHEMHRDDYARKMGMWLFLFTELLLFGGLFVLYMSYRVQYNLDFSIAAKELKVNMGTLNTIILLTSSLTMVLSIVALQRHNKKLSLLYLALTELFALAFLVVKFFEWSAKISHGIYPKGPELMTKPNGEIVFYGLYYAMTGLHAFHIIVGMIILAFMYYFVKKDKITADKFVLLENGGLYWHLVDLIWIFLFPLFYLLH